MTDPVEQTREREIKELRKRTPNARDLAVMVLDLRVRAQRAEEALREADEFQRMAEDVLAKERKQAGQADKLVSKLHDALYSYDGQPTSRGTSEQRVWELHREQMNGLIWKLHDKLRALASPEQEKNG